MRPDYKTTREQVNYFTIPDNSELMKLAERNHPHLMRVLRRKLWQGYSGVRR